MSTPDYYAILGVTKNASEKEISKAYRLHVRKIGLDKLIGQRNKYAALGDQYLLETINLRIARAEEEMKLLNEAKETLRDPAKRKQYDEQVYETKVEVPEIVVSPKTISFGTLTEGQKKSKVFTIENKGGPASSVDISWEGKPDWGDLVIDPNPDTTFPIKVTIIADTTGIPSGTKEEKILVTVDGQTQMVEIYLAVWVVPKVIVAPNFALATVPTTTVVPNELIDWLVPLSYIPGAGYTVAIWDSFPWGNGMSVFLLWSLPAISFIIWRIVAKKEIGFGWWILVLFPGMWFGPAVAWHANRRK